MVVFWQKSDFLKYQFKFKNSKFMTILGILAGIRNSPHSREGELWLFTKFTIRLFGDSSLTANSGILLLQIN